MKSKYSVLIIGGGTAGIMTAAQLLKKDSSLSVGIIDPAETHYYQPAWTLVGGGTYDFDDTVKPMKELIPDGADWIQDYATGFDADNTIVKTQNSGEIAYDYLVVAPGLVMDLTLIDGLETALDKGVVCSNYTDPKHTWEVIQNFKGGNAVFTQPTTPIKCGGAPQKIAYLAADYFKKNKVDARVIFATPGTVLFGVKEIRETLQKVVDRYGMHFKPFYAPVKIDSTKKIITYKYVGDDENQCVTNESKEIGEHISGEALIDMPFDMLHLAPPQTAPKFIKESNLVNKDGWVDVNINSLQHNTYPNIFALGDVAALPTAKTGAAIRKQVPVVVENLMFMLKNKPASNHDYKGYSSCPLVTGYGKMALAEFDYEGNFTPDPKLKQMLVFNSEKEHWRLWMLKKYGLPYLYWNKMMKGEAV
ncbi:NAD(P)/FAD-dependent oxidoreductase [Psychroflexus montanilacus]|uniref:NAD(P)/FAD-dependent oxidoreductase n=1 Tax=Psychroflexus montanilacus TaxID=2873598 RepID=UPI001CCAC83A|nr:FAD/NAD(P)-binding oxidoreductase [Psychroflexus montanilacus]MBZ9651878.1 NAD(P)/FAD-dependent oxidoreductase [Psychroflexus montanilacus]